MFDDTIVVQSAISAFNNAALFTPAFLWNAVLMIPLFIMAYMYGNAFLERFGWTSTNTNKRNSIVITTCIFIWTVLFGGNYDILRDVTSITPYITAAILFACTYFIASQTRDIPVPRVRTLPRKYRLWYIFTIISVFAIIGLTDLHVWWGPVLQIGAVLFGFVLGRRYKFTPSQTFSPILIMLGVITAILMQPEFWRFGQLGNLTMAHLGIIMLIGILFTAIIACTLTRPKGKIHNSAYIKLKWLGRFMGLLMLVLFIMTESVPVFFGSIVVFWALFALSVWHSTKTPEHISTKLEALFMILFGIATGIFVITAIGLTIWAKIPKSDTITELKTLL